MKRNGFTLLEVIVTLAVLGLVFAVTTANFHTLFASSRLEAAGRGLGDHFACAVSRAYTTGRYHTLVFDLTGGTYAIREGREEDASPEILKSRLGKGIKFTDIQVGYDTYAPPGTLSVEISPLGVTNDVLVNLEDEKGRAVAVSLNALVQSVRFFEEHKTYEELQDDPSF